MLNKLSEIFFSFQYFELNLRAKLRIILELTK